MRWLSGLFFLLSMLFYLGYRRQAGWWRYLLALLMFQLALFGKTMVLMLAPVLLLTDRVLDRRAVRGRQIRDHGRPIPRLRQSDRPRTEGRLHGIQPAGHVLDQRRH